MGDMQIAGYDEIFDYAGEVMDKLEKIPFMKVFTGMGKEVAEWMDTLHDIQSLVKLEDYEELKQIAESINPFAAVERAADDIRRSETEVGDEDYMEKLQS